MNVIKLVILIYLAIFVNNTSANDCRNQCNADNQSWANPEGKEYKNLNKEESGKTTFLSQICKARCEGGGCRAKSVSEYLLTEYQEGKIFANCTFEKMEIDDENKRKERESLRAKKKSESLRSALNEYEASKRNYENAIRNPPTPQSRTQTSQNSNSGASYDGSGFVYDSSDHSRCIAVSADLNKRRVNYKNNCNYPVYMQFCQVTDDSSSYSQFQDGANCPGGWPGMRIQANGSDFVRAWNDFNNYRFFMYVCKDGWSPVNQNGKPLFLINESYTCRMLK